MNEPVSHVSDTALLSATIRAIESERSDALFHDPFARRLAGERGESIGRAMPTRRDQTWALVVRIRVFDEIISRLVLEGKMDTILNLASGLDTRAYRLPLPAQTRWFDVDDPEIVAYKAAALAEATPACRYEAVGLDLSDASARTGLFDRVNAESRRVLVVSETQLIYLTNDAVASLATDLAARLNFTSWLIPMASPSLLEIMNRPTARPLPVAHGQFMFAPQEGVRFFEPHGWHAAEVHSTWDAAKRLKRQARRAWLWEILSRLTPSANRDRYRLMAGTVLLERAGPLTSPASYPTV